MSETQGTDKSKEPRSKETYRDVLASLLTGQWPKIVIALFVIELAALFFFSSLPVSSSVEQVFGTSYNQTVQYSNGLGFLPRTGFLFSNNFQIASSELIPILGWISFFTVSYNTGLTLAVAAAGSNVTGPIAMLALLFAPDTWIELPAYAIATVQSLFLGFELTRYVFSKISRTNPREWRNLRFELMRTIIVWILVAIELIVAALFESAAISLGTLSGIGLLWIAFATLIAGLLIARKRFLKNYIASRPIFPSGAQSELAKKQSLPKQGPHLYDTVPIFPIKTTEQKISSKPNFCAKCGAKVESAEAVFCIRCGSKLI